MAMARKKTVRGLWIRATRKAGELRMVASALLSTGHPVLAQIVPARFCNLSCGYCNEYDKVSEPVALEEMFRRIDHLGRLGTAMIGISGGEPLTHPELDEIIRRIRRGGGGGRGYDRAGGRRPADASGAGRDYPANPADGCDCRNDYQRLPAEC